MNTIQALKALYVKLGGNLTDYYSAIADGVAISEYSLITDCVKALYALYGGSLSGTYSDIESDVPVADYSTNPDTIAAVAKVASRGITPTGTISITENGEDIDVTEYASANVNVPADNTDLIDLIERDITSLVIPDGVTKIGDYAFQGTNTLTSVVIPNSVTTIGTQVFSNCTSLTSVFMGNGVTSIGSWAFSNCTNLTDIYYTGTQSQWESIIGISGAQIPGTATIHYEYTP